MAVDRDRKYLYGFHTFQQAGATVTVNAVDAYAIDKDTGLITLINSVNLTLAGMVHLSVHPSGGYVFTAHFIDPGATFVLPVMPNGGLGAPTDMKTNASMSHQAYPHPSGRFLFVPCREGETVMQYSFDERTGKLTDNPPSPTLMPPMGTAIGPRHIDLHPTINVAYVANELGGSVTAYRIDHGTGKMTVIETLSTGRAGESQMENWAAHVLVHPSGKFVYVSNRRQQNIAIFSVKVDGTLTLAGHETGNGIDVPYDFTFDPDANFLIVTNTGSHSLSVYAIDTANGTLAFSGATAAQRDVTCVTSTR